MNSPLNAFLPASPAAPSRAGPRRSARIAVRGGLAALALVLSALGVAIADEANSAQGAPLPEGREADGRQLVIVVVGAAGTAEYAEKFAAWADRWKLAAEKANARFESIGRDGDGPKAAEPEAAQAEAAASGLEAADAALSGAALADRDRLRQQIDRACKTPPQTLWLVLIGHGTFDGREAKFNLRGRDVSAGELAEWLRPLEAPLALINCASASGPFINQLSGPDRVVVAATKSGFEYNFARFGDYLSSAISDESADLDKDQQTSLLEAFLKAAAGTQEFYDQEARLATEHALIDDNGDTLGTPADWFKGFRAVKSAKDHQPDGLRAAQFVLLRRGQEAAMPEDVRSRRDALESQIARLRQAKGELEEDEYYARLEPLLVELARLYDSLDKSPPAPPPPPSN